MDEWLLPIFYYACSRGRISPRDIALFLGIPGSRAKTLVWAFKRRLRSAGDAKLHSVCEQVSWVTVVVRKGATLALLGDGRLVIVRFRRKRLARGYSIPLHLACIAFSEVVRAEIAPSQCRRDRKCLAILARALDTHRKTVSIVLRALELLDCPSSICPLNSYCRRGKEDK